MWMILSKLFSFRKVFNFNTPQLAINVILLTATVVFAARATINNSKLIKAEYTARILNDQVIQLQVTNKAQEEAMHKFRERSTKDYKLVTTLLRQQEQALIEVDNIREQIDVLQNDNEEIKVLFNTALPISIIELLNDQASTANSPRADGNTADSAR